MYIGRHIYMADAEALPNGMSVYDRDSHEVPDTNDERVQSSMVRGTVWRLGQALQSMERLSKKE